MDKLKISKEAHINAPVKKVFDFLTNPKKIPLVLPGLIENTNIPELPLKVDSSFKYKYRMYSVTFEGTWTVTKINSPTLYYAKTDGGVPSEWKYDLYEKDGVTLVKFKVEYEAPKSVLAKLKVDMVKSLNEKEADQYLSNLKNALEM